MPTANALRLPVSKFNAQQSKRQQSKRMSPAEITKTHTDAEPDARRMPKTTGEQNSGQANFKGGRAQKPECDVSSNRMPRTMSHALAAMAEPLAVCLHAVARAGPLLGREVLITGCGPIGALTLIAARKAGAARITVTDVAEPPLAVARTLGADAALDVARTPDALAELRVDKGQIDVAFEASGNPRALNSCLDCTRPGGRVVQLGMLPSGEVALPLTKITPKEIDLVGTFRFHEEFEMAVEALASGRIDVGPVLTGSFPATERDAAFLAAADRQHHLKVQLTFD